MKHGFPNPYVKVGHDQERNQTSFDQRVIWSKEFEKVSWQPFET